MLLLFLKMAFEKDQFLFNRVMFQGVFEKAGKLDGWPNIVLCSFVCLSLFAFQSKVTEIQFRPVQKLELFEKNRSRVSDFIPCLERKKRFEIVYQNIKYVNFYKPIPSRRLGPLYIFPYGIVTVISGPCHLV